MRFRFRSLVLALATFVIAANLAAQTNVGVSYHVDQNWGTGMQGSFRITNQGSNITGWRFGFDFPYSITATWDATIVSHSGNHYVVSGAGWNNNLPSGGTVSFGFNAEISGSTAGPTNCSLQNQPISSSTCPASGGGGGTPTDTVPPSVPGGLHTSSVTATSISLAWSASTDNSGGSGLAGYEVFKNGASAATPTSTNVTITGLTAGTTYQFSVRARDNDGNISALSPEISATTTSGSTPPPNPGATSIFAPYVDVTLWPTPSLPDMSSASGAKHFTLAFIVDSGSCKASWGGVIPLLDNLMKADVDTLRSAGGDVIVSFGGANGVELAQGCADAASLQAQYQAVIDTYSLTRIDFDVEGGATADPVSIDRRNKVIAALQAAARSSGKQLIVQFTLPVLPTGLTPDGVNVIQNAVDNGVDISVVNIMAMDYGGPEVADPNQMGQAAINAANSTLAQLKTIYGSSRTDAQLKNMLGVTPMIGLNDVVPEVFTLTADAPLLLNYARQNQIGLLSMWSATRDSACPDGGSYVSPTCSGIQQAPFAFSKLFVQFGQ